MSEEGREPGSVAGAQAKVDGAALAAGEPAVTEPAAVIPGARQPEETADEHAELERLRAEVRELREHGEPRATNRSKEKKRSYKNNRYDHNKDI